MHKASPEKQTSARADHHGQQLPSSDGGSPRTSRAEAAAVPTTAATASPRTRHEAQQTRSPYSYSGQHQKRPQSRRTCTAAEAVRARPRSPAATPAAIPAAPDPDEITPAEKPSPEAVPSAAAQHAEPIPLLFLPRRYQPHSQHQKPQTEAAQAPEASPTAAEPISPPQFCSRGSTKGGQDQKQPKRSGRTSSHRNPAEVRTASRAQSRSGHEPQKVQPSARGHPAERRQGTTAAAEPHPHQPRQQQKQKQKRRPPETVPAATRSAPREICRGRKPAAEFLKPI